MYWLIRALLGLCNHRHETYKVEDIPWRSNDNGSFITTNMSVRGDIRCRRHWQQCAKCGHLKQVDVKMGKRR